MRSRLARRVSYVQGQAAGPRSREYFYYVDHQGQLFLDDARLKNFITCFKGEFVYCLLMRSRDLSPEKKFLAFFFKRLKCNVSGRYEEAFPYVSPCGREMNYVHCDDLPVVFTHLLTDGGHVIQEPGQHTGSGSERLSYGGAGELLSLPFDPSGLCMLPDTGRVYYYYGGKGGLEGSLGGVGLVKSSLALELSRCFTYAADADDQSAPEGFSWQGRTFRLDGSVLSKLHRP